MDTKNTKVKPFPWRARLYVLFLCVLGVLCGDSAVVVAQMDFKQASGIPRPVDDLPAGTISIRVIRGDLSHPVPNHPIELSVDGRVRTQTTDEEGRAEFLAPDAERVKATTVVDGQRLDSQEFRAPATGGIRMLLVAIDKEEAARAEEAAKSAVTGPVIIGRKTQIVIEPEEEILRVYYLLEIINERQEPVNPPTPFIFDAPTGAQSTTIMEGSTPQASASDATVRVLGPFAPGATFVQVAYAFRTPGGAAEIAQTFPAALEHLAVIVKKVGDARLSSPQLARQQEMPAGGDLYIAAAGSGPVPAGQPIVLSISGLPHHSAVPRWIALGLAIAITLIGAWAVLRPQEAETRAAERKRLIARREKLFQELVRLETDHRRGRVDPRRYAARRVELMSSLENVYGALESDDPGVAA